jgi:hypothetical protein
MTALPACVQVGNLTLHAGRVMTALSDSEAQLLHSALQPETPKETFAPSPDNDGVYSYVIGAKDYFAPVHLPRQFPERMIVSCALDPSLGLKNVVISDLKSGTVYCQAHFDRPAMATQAPASEQAASSMAANCKHTPGGVVSMASSQSDSTSSVLKGSNSKRVQDPDNPDKTVSLGALRLRQKVTDPDTGETISKNALRKRQARARATAGAAEAENA